MTAALHRTFRAFVATGSGLNEKLVIPGNRKGVIPKEPFATVLERTDERTGYPIFNYGENGAVATLQYRVAQLSVQFYREGAGDLALNLSTYAESVNGLARMVKDDFRIQFPFSIQQLDEVIGDGYEERRLIDLGVLYAHGTDQTTDYLDSIVGNLRYDGIETEVTHGP